MIIYSHILLWPGMMPYVEARGSHVLLRRLRKSKGSASRFDPHDPRLFIQRCIQKEQQLPVFHLCGCPYCGIFSVASSVFVKQIRICDPLQVLTTVLSCKNHAEEKLIFPRLQLTMPKVWGHLVKHIQISWKVRLKDTDLWLPKGPSALNALPGWHLASKDVHSSLQVWMASCAWTAC